MMLVTGRCSADMQLDHLAEMEAYDGQHDS